MDLKWNSEEGAVNPRTDRVIGEEHTPAFADTHIRVFRDAEGFVGELL